MLTPVDARISGWQIVRSVHGYLEARIVDSSKGMVVCVLSGDFISLDPEGTPYNRGGQTMPRRVLDYMLEKESEETQAVYRRRRPYKPDMIRVERGDFERRATNGTCTVCGCENIEHEPVIGYPWLNRLCDGSLVKL
jgi:hypothetical protein